MMECFRFAIMPTTRSQSKKPKSDSDVSNQPATSSLQSDNKERTTGSSGGRISDNQDKGSGPSGGRRSANQEMPAADLDGQPRESEPVIRIPSSMVHVECGAAIFFLEANINIGGKMTKTKVCDEGHLVYKKKHYLNREPAPILKIRDLNVLSQVGLENEDEEQCIMSIKNIPKSKKNATSSYVRNKIIPPVQLENEDEEDCIMMIKSIAKNPQSQLNKINPNDSVVQLEEETIHTDNKQLKKLVHVEENVGSNSPKSFHSDKDDIDDDSNPKESDYEFSPIIKTKHPYDMPRKPLVSDESSQSSLSLPDIGDDYDSRSVFNYTINNCKLFLI